jgi:Flp pilus assembly protein TadG
MKILRRETRSNVQLGEEGSALVELAFTMPLLLLMLLGAAELAMVAYAAIEVSNAAHTAAVYAASSQAALADSPGISNAAATDSTNLVGGSSISVTSITTACTCANTAYAPTSCSDNQTCQQNNTSMVTTVRVQTQATVSPFISIVGKSFTLYGQSSQVVSNQ